ncbi:MAG: YqjF family protein [Bacteroidia bacterium]
MQPEFLSAYWKNLVMMNYEVEPELLKPFLPANTELDLFNGKCFLSLVGFMFLETKVWGIKWPKHTNFEEVNLRFYVKYNTGTEWRRGVVFIKEIVSKHIITLMANSLYNEQYETMRMRNRFEQGTDHFVVSYSWKKPEWNSISVKASVKKKSLQKESLEEFITEHYWGYTSKNSRQTYEYAVEHPQWLIHDIESYELDCNFKEVYGERFDFLQARKPDTVFMAEGSEILVRKAKLIG